MKRVIIRNLDGVQTHGAEIDAPDGWIESCISLNLWGRSERWQREYNRWEPRPGVEAYAPEDVIAEEDRPHPTEEGQVEHWVKLRADYTVEVEDITAEHALRECIAARLKEYPSAADFLNAFFDEGEEGLDRLRALRLEIKAKHPKPSA